MRALVAQTPGVARTEAIRLRTSGAAKSSVRSSSRHPARCRWSGRRRSRGSLRRGLANGGRRHIPITANPIALDDETILERVLLVATRRRLPVHHITIQDTDGRKSVALDLEVDGAMTLSAAHSIASDLEEAIAAEIGEDVEVETTSSLPNQRLGARPPTPISHAASRPSSPAPSASRSAFATSTTCECARHLAVSLCCSIAALIRQRRLKPFTPPSTRWSARCGRRFRRFAARSDMRSHQAEARREKGQCQESARSVDAVPRTHMTKSAGS